MDFELFEKVFGIVSAYIYELIEILFGVVYNEETGKLEKK